MISPQDAVGSLPVYRIYFDLVHCRIAGVGLALSRHCEDRHPWRHLSVESQCPMLETAIELPTTAITNVKAITPWHGLGQSCRVHGAESERRFVGDMLLRYEAVELAKRLHTVVSQSEHH